MAGSLAYLVSPLTVLLQTKTKLSHRAVVILGAVVFSAGLLATSFVPALGYAYLTFGLLAGIGANFIAHSSMALLLEWFEKKDIARSCPLAVMGSACGTCLSQKF